MSVEIRFGPELAVPAERAFAFNRRTITGIPTDAGSSARPAAGPGPASAACSAGCSFTSCSA